MTQFLIHLHLYNMDLLNEFIQYINNFIQINPEVSTHLFLTIPIDNNINNFIFKTNQIVAPYIKNEESENKLQIIASMIQNQMESKYDEFFYRMNQKVLSKSYWLNESHIHKRNSIYLLSLIKYILKTVHLDKQNIDYRFIINKGQDIGGFLATMKYLKETGSRYDYYCHLHTKTAHHWRKEMIKILNVPVKMYVGRYDVVYSKHYNFAYSFTTQSPYFRGLMHILRLFGYPPHSFHFSAGTFFICGNKIISEFMNKNIDHMFHELHYGKQIDTGTLEYCYERFFGYMFDYHKQRKLLIQ
jgi:hypothetical protein